MSDGHATMRSLQARHGLPSRSSHEEGDVRPCSTYSVSSGSSSGGVDDRPVPLVNTPPNVHSQFRLVSGRPERASTDSSVGAGRYHLSLQRRPYLATEMELAHGNTECIVRWSCVTVPGNGRRVVMLEATNRMSSGARSGKPNRQSVLSGKNPPNDSPSLVILPAPRSADRIGPTLRGAAAMRT
jgi:hypothetical protein